MLFFQVSLQPLWMMTKHFLFFTNWKQKQRKMILKYARCHNTHIDFIGKFNEIPRDEIPSNLSLFNNQFLYHFSFSGVW